MADVAASDLAQLLGALGGLTDEATAPRLVGIGWATVDVERTIAGLLGTDVRPTHPDELLGARAWRVAPGPTMLLILEPATEGRLSATLARRGEGIAALYLHSDGPLDGTLRPTAMGLPGRLTRQERTWGPYLILVAGH